MSARARMDPRDRAWAIAATIAGGAAMLLASRAAWSPADLSPGVEGCSTAVVAGFVMGLLHPLRYRHALAVTAPGIAALYGLVALADGRPIAAGVTGLELVLLGFIGIAMATGEPREPVARAGRRTSAPRPLSSHA